MRKEICFSSGLSFRKTNMIPLDDAMGPVMHYPYDKVFPKAYEQTGQGIVRFHLYFPKAHSVSLRTYTSEYELTGKDGYWIGEFEVGTGFIVIFVIVDGNETLYQGLPIGFGGNRPINYIELGTDNDIAEPLDCSHGTVSIDYFDSQVSKRLERIYVYLPPDYYENKDHKYPILYLQHGHGENETAWVNQGKVNFILDKLISEGKAEPMIVVMCNGMVSYELEDEIFVGAAEKFEEMLIGEVIPYVENKYRVYGSKAYRGMAGLSMGSMQTSVITLKHQDMFDYVGIFSGFVRDFLSGCEEHIRGEYLDTFSENVKCIFRAMGDKDIFYPNFCSDDRLLEEHHVKHERVIYEGEHEWKVWQRCFYDFAQKIFKYKEEAEQFADMVYTPRGIVRPTKRQVMDFLVEQVAIDEEAVAACQKEEFVCHNGEVKIYGEYYPLEHAVGCAVLAHGFAQNRYILIPQQKLFRELGFSTVIFDQRAFGESTEQHCTFGIKEAQDVACVVDWARKKCGKDVPIVLLGVSMGAAASMKALEYTENIDYLVEDCGFADIESVIDDLYRSMHNGERNPEAAEIFKKKTEELGLDMNDNRPIDSVGKSNIPVCIFHGTADSTIGVEHAKSIFEVCKHSDSRLELFEEKEHALCVTDAVRYKAVLREFLKEIL